MMQCKQPQSHFQNRFDRSFTSLYGFVVAVTLACWLACWPLADGCHANDSFQQTIQPLLQDHCITCHSTEKQEGELDLERFRTLDDVKRDTEVWERVEEQLNLGEMPPKDAPQLSDQQQQRLSAWVLQTLDDIALSNAGDPGPVVLRRLSNHEYTYTLRDLTGVETLDPAREFPVDGAAGEGFTNVGSALVMSPGLLSKYLEAAKKISRHLVLLDDGFRFSGSDSQQDWTDEALAKIQTFYARYTTTGDASQSLQQGISLELGTDTGRLPLSRYLDALQGRGDAVNLSPKYLRLLRDALESDHPSPLMAPLCTKYRARELTVADIQAWQKVLWRFNTVGHIGKAGGPKAWQEPITPMVARHEMQWKLKGDRDQTLYLVATNAGDGDHGDQVVWEGARLIAKGRPDLPIQSLREAAEFLRSERRRLIDDSQACLAALAAGTESAPQKSLAVWREYLGFGVSKLEPLIDQKMESVSGYSFVRGWGGDNALSVLANSSDNAVRIPGMMPAHSVATHPSPDRASVLAWKSAATSRLTVQGSVLHAHPECGNGVAWTVEVRRGQTTERLASGVSDRSNEVPFGPFENIRIEPGQVVALVVSPRDGNHSCDLTTVNLTLSDGVQTWDLASDVSPNILAGNPQGPWHFLSQPASPNEGSDLPPPIAAWCQQPSAEQARLVREYLSQEMPLTHPLLAIALRSFEPTAPSVDLTARAPSVHEISIPAELAEGATLVVTGRLSSSETGSVQMQILDQKPSSNESLIAGQASTDQQKAHWSDNQTITQHSWPIIVNASSPEQQQFEAAFEEFRSLFPIALCYERIVPVDEVVTLTLYYREDEHLQRLMLDEEEASELNRMWNQLLFVSNAPLKQVDAFEQLWQFATQDADPSAFEPLREPIHAAAIAFRKVQEDAEVLQKRAMIELAARAWRRPLSTDETGGITAVSATIDAGSYTDLALFSVPK
jgi:mono/diheme cytochrome c family protein